MTTPSLHKNALLVALKVSCWGANKIDNGASEAIAAQNNANSKAVKLHKHLADKNALKDVRSKAVALRNVHNRFTSAWNDSYRIVPVSAYAKYKSELDKAIADYKQAFTTFCDGYDALKLSAQNSLGALWKESEFPTKAQLLRKFGVEKHSDKVTDTNDFRLDGLDAATLEAIKSEVADGISANFTNACRDLIGRILETLSHYKTRVSDKDLIFSKAASENLAEVAEIVRSLNLTNDARINDLCDKVAELAAIEPVSIRENDGVRNEAASKADELLKEANDIASLFA